MKLFEITKDEFVDRLTDPGKAKVKAWIEQIRQKTSSDWVLDYDVLDSLDEFGNFELMFRYEGNKNIEHEMDEMVFAINDTIIGEEMFCIDKYKDDRIIITTLDIK